MLILIRYILFVFSFISVDAHKYSQINILMEFLIEFYVFYSCFGLNRNHTHTHTDRTQTVRDLCSFQFSELKRPFRGM